MGLPGMVAGSSPRFAGVAGRGESTKCFSPRGEECMDGGAGCGTGSFLKATATAEATGQSLEGLGSGESSHGLHQIMRLVVPGEGTCPFSESLQKLKKALKPGRAVTAVQRSFAAWLPLSSRSGTSRSPACFGAEGGHLPGHVSCWALSAGHPPSPSPPFPEGQVDSLLSIISSQRERFRARNQELEGVCGVGRVAVGAAGPAAGAVCFSDLLGTDDHTMQAAPQQAREK